MSYTTSLAPFPLSSSRGTRQLPSLPSSLCTTLPPLPATGHFTPRHQPETMFPSFTPTDSYFQVPAGTLSPARSPTSESSSLSPSSEPRKRTSIPSLLSSPEFTNSSGGETSPAASPNYHWSNSNVNSSTQSRSGSVETSPVQLPSLNHAEFQTPRNVFEEEKPFNTNNASRRKLKTVSRSTSNENSNRDGYDCLGRKKPKTPRTPMSWDPKDDILLKQLKEEQRLGWKEIATHFRGRTSHACQFRWRRLASGQLKYYQGHRRPPTITTTAASFAAQMTSAAAPIHHNTPPVSPTAIPTHTTHAQSHAHHHNLPHAHTLHNLHKPLPTHRHTNQLPLTPLHHQLNPMAHHNLTHTHSANAHNHNMFPMFYQPTPLPSPTSWRPLFPDWRQEEDELLLDRRLSFDEVNVLLSGRSEQEIWERMVKLRGSDAGNTAPLIPMLTPISVRQ